jgi:hypothetical protein
MAKLTEPPVIARRDADARSIGRPTPLPRVLQRRPLVQSNPQQSSALRLCPGLFDNAGTIPALGFSS